MSEPPSESGDKKRPTPVRALEPPPAVSERANGERTVPTPARSYAPSTPGRPGAVAAAPAPDAGTAEGSSDGDREARAVTAHTEPAEEAPVVFWSGEEEWVARVLGFGRGGTTPDVGAPLMAVGFAPAGDPERPVLEALCVGRRVSDLSEDELVALVARARPYRSPAERPEIFSETRVRKKEL